MAKRIFNIIIIIIVVISLISIPYNFIRWLRDRYYLKIDEQNFNEINELFDDVKRKFIETLLNSDYTLENLAMYEYQKPDYYILMIDFYKHCEKGKEINFKSLENEL